VAEGAPLLREYAGKNLHPGFESLSLRQTPEPATRRAFFFAPLGLPVPNDLVSILVLVAMSAVTFTVARFLSRNWRRKRRQKEEGARLSAESRQVRRARERRQRGK
jgi:hypothetical protein